MNEMCGDNRFEIIARAKKALLEGTNIETDEAEMKVIDNILFRCWQMGWLDRYDTSDTPQTERIKTPDYCDICNHKGCDNCIANSLDDYCVPSGYEPITQTETQNSNLTFDTPQTDCGWGEPK